MASMDRKMRLSRWDPVLLSGFARNVAAPSQSCKSAARPPESPKRLRSVVLGSWVGLSDMRVKRRCSKRNSSPGVRRHRSAS